MPLSSPAPGDSLSCAATAVHKQGTIVASGNPFSSATTAAAAAADSSLALSPPTSPAPAAAAAGQEGFHAWMVPVASAGGAETERQYRYVGGAPLVGAPRVEGPGGHVVAQSAAAAAAAAAARPAVHHRQQDSPPPLQPQPQRARFGGFGPTHPSKVCCVTTSCRAAQRGLAGWLAGWLAGCGTAPAAWSLPPPPPPPPPLPACVRRASWSGAAHQPEGAHVPPLPSLTPRGWPWWWCRWPPIELGGSARTRPPSRCRTR
jgi:hypothetical protein